jgi:RNA-directed DNA polymerase
MVIEPIFETRFAKHSYGFRPGCGCKDALRRVEELLRAGNTNVVDVDIKGYLDWLMAGHGFEMVRYADDMVVLCRSQEEAMAALEKLREWMAEAGLTLHPDKTRTVDMGRADSHFDFLGYRFKRSRRGRLIRLVRPKSLRKLRESIKPRTRRNNGRSMEAIVADINRTLQGWFAYFKHIHPSELEVIDQWMRVRLRSILRKRRGGRGRGRGQDHHRWPNRYFTGLGLFCLLDAKVTETASLRSGANH